jgi:hypothetical protein
MKGGNVMRTQVWKGALILLLCLPLALSCSKKNPTRPQEEGSGGGAVATVSLTSDKLQLNPERADQARLQATVKDASGKGVSKVIVHFTSKLGSGVTLAPDSSLTDSAGQAISTLRSTTAGLDTLTASVGSVSGKIRINYSNFTLVIDSLSQTVPPGQGTIVRATLKKAGTPVLGRRLAYSVSASRGAQIREQPPYSWTTDSGGHARAFYVAGNTTGFDTVCVTDSALSLTGQNFISVGGGSSEDTIPATILIQKVTSYFLVVRGGGGIETSEITILVLNRNGTPIKKSVRVDFSFVQPLGGGEFFAPSSGWTSLTDGTLTTVLNSGYRSGTLKFIATVFGTTVRTHPTLVTIRSGPPDQAHMTILSNTCILPGRTPYLGDLATITAFIADQWGNPVPLTAVWFYTNQCMVFPGNAVTDETGVCTNTFRTAAPNDSSFATVTVETRDSLGARITKSLRITLYGLANTFTLSPQNWVIDKINGPKSIYFTLTAQDDHGIGLPGTYRFTISPEGWTLPPDFTYGPRDCLPSGQIPFVAEDTLQGGYRGPATVTATWTGLYQTVSVTDPGTIR